MHLLIYIAWGESNKKSFGFIIDFHYENEIFNVDLFKNYETIIHENPLCLMY